jgi:multiple sugar transport system substrate-binding protein
MKKTIIILPVCIVLLALSFAACNKSGGSAGASGGAKTELTLWLGSWWNITAEGLAADFNAQFPQYNLKIDLLPINGYQDNAIASILAGNPPDILDIDLGWVSTFASRDLLSDLTDQVKDRLNPADFIKSAWDSSIYNGKLYGIPNRGLGAVIFYNKNIFDQAGVPYPVEGWTYAEYLSTAQKLTIPGQRYGAGIAADASDPSNVFTCFAPVLWAFGGEFFSTDGKKCLMNTPEAVQAIAYYTELYTKHKVVPEGSLNYTISRDVLPLFDQNTVAMLPFGVQAVNTFNANPNLKYGVVQLPQNTCRSAGWTFTIPVTSAHPKEALDFIFWYSQPAVMAKHTAIEPSLLKVWEDYPPWNGPVHKELAKAANNGRPLPSISSWGQASLIIVNELQQVLQGRKTPQQGGDSMVSQIEPLL